MVCGYGTVRVKACSLWLGHSKGEGMWLGHSKGEGMWSVVRAQ